MYCDCVIIGAGPAGLHCSTYLGRFMRKVVIFHGGKARAEWIPLTHNFPGFPQGVTGQELLKLMRRQAEHYDTEFRREEIHSIEFSNERFVVKGPKSEIATPKIVLATGVEDIPPNVPNAHHYKGRTIRHCPICDAYEARGRRIVIFGPGKHAARLALWLFHYSPYLTILMCGLGKAEDIPPVLRTKLADKNIMIFDSEIRAIEEHGEELGTVVLEDSTRLENIFRGYSAMGLKPNSELAAGIGIELDDKGFIKVDGNQETSVKGIYAVGDVVSGDIGQLSVAMGHAATAATAVHNSLLSV